MAVYGPSGVAVDAAGNTYIANSSVSNYVLKQDPDGRESRLSFRYLQVPYGVTVDTAGTVYVTDYKYDSKYQRGFVYRLTVGGVETRIEIPELRNPTDVHVDAAGNLYVVDSWNDRIVRVAPNGTQETIPPGNLAFPFGIVVDGAGTITVSNSEDRIGIIRLDAAGNRTTVPFTGLDRSMGLDIDSAGNIYVVQAGFQSSAPRVLKMTPDGVQSVLPFGPGVLHNPRGVAVTDNTILVADEYGLKKLAL
ncbi:hypothetical protein F3087_02805 [Nocardia colli]|uniref:SMP-30/Gluconolactonase/LRE-like region domain-containing protein n=1 Tax=Nocardia colli TaxID=2545717 RepID=A0A5N0EQ91_9NOCA|nr:hypothetical protein [Nocardia colli]KAA8890255.1 hypothetical protein F3087_02805 [Nocardia colli]